ncbi:MAG: DUF3352 domain-containing protein [Planctomycetota bacterium]|jgi:hypothetical protein
MEKRLGKSGLRLCIGFLGLLMLVGTGSSYAQSSLKNTPLYKHLIKRRTSKPATPRETKPVVARSALPQTAKLLPPDTAFVVSIENVSRLRGQFENTDLFKLYKDPSMAAFVDNFKVNLQQMIEDSDSELAEIVSDAAALPQGRAAVALVLNEEVMDTGEPPVLLIAEWGDKAAQAKDMIEKIFAEGVEEGQARRQTEDYRGVVITSTTGESSDSESYCFIDDTMILSGDTEIMKFVIAQVKGAGSPALADDEVYNSTLKAVSSSGPGQIDVYVNIQQIIRTVTAQDEAGLIKGILTKLGLDNVTSFAFSFDVGSTSGRALLKIDGPRKGICKLLEFESGPIQVPRFVPASANSISFVNLNVKKAFDEIVKIVTSFSPEIAMMVNMPLSPPGPEGEQPLQLKTGIIDHLGSQIVVAQSAAGSVASADAQDAPESDSLLALAVTNRAALEKSLLAIHSNIMGPDDPDARRELFGHTIYRVDLFSMMFGLGGGLGDTEMMMGEMPDMEMEMDMDVNMPDMEMEMDMNMPDMAMEMDMNMPDMEMEMDMDMEMPMLAFTVTDTHFIFGGEEAAERAIRTLRRSGGKSLASAEWFTQAKSAIPSEVGLAVLQNSEAFAESAWSKLRNIEMAAENEEESLGLIDLAGVPSPQMLLSLVGADQLDFSLLPDFDAVRKYFGLSASYGIARQDGFFFEFKYINPK